MKINKKELLSKIKSVQPGLTKKEVLEQSTHFVFTGDEIATHNGTISVRCPCKTDFKCSVLAHKFYEILSTIEEEDVDISVKGKELLIKSAKVRSGMSIMVDDTIQTRLASIPNVKKWKPLPEDFIKGLFLCMFSVSKDMYCGVLNCVQVTKEDIYSSDDLRISHYQMAKKMTDTFLLPLAVVTELVKFKMVKYSLDEDSSWIQFMDDHGLLFSSRCVKDTYPDASQFLNVEGIKVNLPKKLQESIDIVCTIIDDFRDIEKRMTVVFEENRIICKAEQEKGWIEKEMEIKYKGKSLSLNINPVFLHEILNKSTNMIIGGDRALFTSDAFQHVMVLPAKEVVE